MKYLIGLAVLMFSLNGYSLPGIESCQDINGIPVQVKSASILTQAAESNITNGLPVILLNPQLMNQQNTGVQKFILAHECAHHRLGHVAQLAFQGYLPLTVEFDADCLAIRTLRELKLLNDMTLKHIQEFLSTLAANSTHPAGSYRAEHAKSCSL